MTRPRQTITVLPVAQLAAHPGNIRDDLGDLTDMARSIREHGILQPLTVTEHPDAPDQFLLLDGHRRLKAALLAHETKAPVIIRHDLEDPAEQTLVMLVTGIHRRELSPAERARGYGRLRDTGLTGTEIARRTGVSPATVTNYLNLLRLDDATLDRIDAGEVRVVDAMAAVKQQRQAERADVGKPLRGRPIAYFGTEHPLAAAVAQTCKHTPSYGGIGCGLCWEAAIRADVTTAVSA